MWFVSVSVSVIVSVNRLLISFAWICKAFGEHPCGCVRVYRMTLRAAAAVSVAASANCYCFANKIRSITCWCCCCCCHYILYPFAIYNWCCWPGCVCQMASHAWAIRQQGKATTNASLQNFCGFKRRSEGGRGLGILRKFSWIYSLRDWLPDWLIAWATHAWRTDVNAKFSTALPLKLQIKAAKAL